LSTVLKKINGLSLPNISLSAGDGHVQQNRVFIKQRAQDVRLETNDANNSIAVTVKNLYLFMRSQDFRYNFWFVPIKATLDVQVANVGLDFEIQLSNTTVYWFNNDTGRNETRIVPQILVPRCVLSLDPTKMEFDIGGSFIA